MTNHENRLTAQFTSIIYSFVSFFALGFHGSFFLVLLSLPPTHLIGVRDHLGFSMDGWMGQYLSTEDWNSNEGCTKRAVEGGDAAS